MITIQVNDKQVLDMLAELSRRMANLQPAMKEIGEDIVASTKRRFASSTGPDGTPWAANSPVTIELFMGLHTKNYTTEDGSLLPNKNFKKDGSLSKRGEARVAAGAAKKPLIGKTNILGTDINLQPIGTTGVSIGSPMVYAAMQQFGGVTSPRSMIPGKTIPARPFLGLSAQDKANILDILGTYLVR